MKMNVWLMIGVALGLALNVSTATVSYWELDGANWDGRDSVGTHDLVPIGTNVDSALMVNPIPNPDTSLPFDSVDDAATNPRGSFFNQSEAWYSPNSGVEAEHDDTFDFAADKSFTVEGWVRGLATGIIAGVRHANPAHQYAGNYKGWAVYFSGGGTSMTFYVDGAAATGYARQIVVSGLTANTLMHFAAVYDKDGFAGGIGQMELFIDGDSKGTATAASQWSWHRGGSLAIGARDTGTGFNSWMAKGSIDEIRYSDEALNANGFLNAPEPTTMLLLAVGGMLLRRRK